MFNRAPETSDFSSGHIHHSRKEDLQICKFFAHSHFMVPVDFSDNCGAICTVAIKLVRLLIELKVVNFQFDLFIAFEVVASPGDHTFSLIKF